MEISSDYVGTLLKPNHGTPRWLDTMNYAAALNVDNPHYFDVLNQEGRKAISRGWALLSDDN